jgi:uncharacterized membrane protein
MTAELFLRWLHVIGASVLFGTGAGIAFFMVMARRMGDVRVIAGVSRIVVLADFVFTAAAVVAQPVSGILLAHFAGWSLGEGWLILSILLYVVTGLFWLPVVWIQVQLRDMAVHAALKGERLPPRFERLFRIWFWCGFPAFFSVLAILWLMLAKPAIGLP